MTSIDALGQRSQGYATLARRERHVLENRNVERQRHVIDFDDGGVGIAFATRARAVVDGKLGADRAPDRGRLPLLGVWSD